MTALDSFLTVLRPVDDRHKGAKTLSFATLQKYVHARGSD